jgi:hypothetical protein
MAEQSNGTVLVVDDEPTIVEIVARYLDLTTESLRDLWRTKAREVGLDREAIHATFGRRLRDGRPLDDAGGSSTSPPRAPGARPSSMPPRRCRWRGRK